MVVAGSLPWGICSSVFAFSSPSLLFLTVSLWLILAMVESVNIARTQVEIGTGKEDEEIVTGERIHFKYTTVTGFFLQSEVETDPADFEFVSGWL